MSASLHSGHIVTSLFLGSPVILPAATDAALKNIRFFLTISRIPDYRIPELWGTLQSGKPKPLSWAIIKKQLITIDKHNKVHKKAKQTPQICINQDFIC